MKFVKTESRDKIFLIQLNRPDRLNAINQQIEHELKQAWADFRTGSDEVAIITGAGRAFCVGEDMKESSEQGLPDDAKLHDGSVFGMGGIEKPIIAAVNGYALGGGFMITAEADFRVAAEDAEFESSEAKRWLLGGVEHNHQLGLPAAVTAELAFAYRIPARRLYETGFLNRMVPFDQVLPAAYKMAEHLLSLPPATRLNTLRLLRSTRPTFSDEHREFAAALRLHGAQHDLIESRLAFVEKREPRFIGWDDPADRYRGPQLQR